ncbi:SMI1/KNR4 family protein [Flavobacterium sp. TBRC 19031]|uniref:SMI1/KNR4 family protein n=1 Tax=Flavobacterium mekongense TaxID=3379707 RepID=UPI00399C17C9
MNITTKFQKILAFQMDNKVDIIDALNNTISISQIDKIENLLKEKLPDDIIELYTYANGQKQNDKGIFFDFSFCTADEIIKQLEFSKSLLNPKIKDISNPEQSEKMIKKVVDLLISKAPKSKFFGLQKAWYSIVFSCSTNSSEGPYLYVSETSKDLERKILNINSDEHNKILEIVKQLKDLEKKTYKWDKLKMVIYASGNYKVDRSTFNFNNDIPFTSNPINAIQKKYFHYKWLPIFSDSAGNYIGIDLDPDKKGKKGQVINFGRDEENMFVFADNLDNFFDKILNELDKKNNLLLNSSSLTFETLKEITKSNQDF